MALKESQRTLLGHSEAKIKLLDLYLKRYLRIVSASKYFGDIHVYDLFCGEGIYPNGGKGSPIIILETIRDAYYSSQSAVKSNVNFNCLFNDWKREHVDKLAKIIESNQLHHKRIGRLRFENKNYRSLLPTIVQEINDLKNEKAFIFIDPYGYKDIKANDIKTLLDNKRSEVLLFLPTQFMFRFEKKGTPRSLIDLIDELIPEEEWPNSKTGIDFIENLKTGFQHYLGDDFFVDTFVIQRDLNQFFCLFFFTSHIYGFEQMLDVKWKMDEEEGRGWLNETELNLFTDLEKKPNSLRLKQNLSKFLKNGKRTNADVYRFTLDNSHLPKHSMEILKEMFREGKLKTFKKDGEPARKNAFYLNYKSYKEDPDRIFFKVGENG